MWLRRAEDEARAEGRPIAVEWRTFSLEQVNSRTPETKVWDHPERRWRSVAALAAAHAARRLDPGRFPAFHMALFEARHQRAQDLSDPATLDAVAEAVGYDRAAFAAARASVEAWQEVGRDHEAAAARGVFGTPTLVFGPKAVFLKMQPVPEEESALTLLEDIVDLHLRAPYILEMKQPEALTASARG
ncbi:MAG TPA: DsbA family protein [Thermodesulfobacteriota bacterium]